MGFVWLHIYPFWPLEPVTVIVDPVKIYFICLALVEIWLQASTSQAYGSLLLMHAFI